MRSFLSLTLLACAAAPELRAQDIAEIAIETNAARIAGDPTTFFVMAFFVEGSGFTSVDVTPPGGTAVTLTFDPSEGAFLFESSVFASLAALRTQYPLGNYLFDLGLGAPSFALPLTDVEPPGFADITHPPHNGLAFALPTLSWTTCGGCAPVAAVDVGLERLSNGDVLLETAFFPGASGNINFATGMATPTPLSPLPPLSALVVGEEYELGVDIVRGTSTTLNVAGDDFEYSTFFRKDLDVRFSVAGVDVTCTGDGGGMAGCTPCPCGNDAPVGTLGGCLNSADTSAQLVRSGSADVSNDTLRFEARNATPNTFIILVSANNLLPNMGPCPAGSGIQSPVLDGLRCVGGGLVRHGTRPTDSNGDAGRTTNGWGPPNGPAGGLAANGGFVVGQTRRFQAFYREDPAQVCGRGQNTTNAISVTFF